MSRTQALMLSGALGLVCAWALAALLQPSNMLVMATLLSLC